MKRESRMMINRSWFAAMCCFSVCLITLYYLLIPTRERKTEGRTPIPSIRIIHKQTKHGKLCIEENICKNDSIQESYTYVRPPNFYNLIEQDIDLKRNTTHSERVVPSVVHYTWYGGYKKGNNFRFHHMLAIMSAHKFIKPSRIYFWHDLVPEGHYWTEIKQRVPELCLVYRKSPKEIRGRIVRVAEHLTDVVRLEAVMEFGGMYFDLDVMILKPLDPLLVYDVSMGYEHGSGLCNGIIIGKAWADFLKIWHKEYKSFKDNDWAHHSVALPAILARKYKNLIHTEATSLHRPNWMELPLLYEVGKLYDWRNGHYASHLWIRRHKTEHNPEDIKTWNTTVGEMWRWIYYGDWRLQLPNKTQTSNSTQLCIVDGICRNSSDSQVYIYRRSDDFYKKIDSDDDKNHSIQNKQVVPNIVHYTWYGGLKKGNTFRFHHLLSILSAHKFIKPKYILFWHDMIPEGPYWKELNEKVPEIRFVYRKTPKGIRGKNVSVPEHLTDIVRLEAVLEYGGYYFDLDVMVLKSFEPFQSYDTTMGYESSNGLCNGIIISKPWAAFLKIWHKEYKSFKDSSWAYHSVILPAALARKHPGLVHTEAISMHRPNWAELDKLYTEGNLYNWRKNNYAMHLWIRFHNIEHTSEDIKYWNTTVGEIFRHIYYGDWKLVEVPETKGKICFQVNLCKENESDISWRYIRLSSFRKNVDRVYGDIETKYHVVPNIVHFTWYGALSRENNFRFHHHLSVLAAHKFIKPVKIYFWHDTVPEGPYWNELKKKVPELVLVYRPCPTEIRGKQISVADYVSNIISLEAVLEYGGIYLDLDVMAVKSFDPLLKLDVAMGYEKPEMISSGIIVGKPWAEFLRIWHKSYDTLKDKQWMEQSVLLPKGLAKQHPKLIHIEAESMHRPNWQELSSLYETGQVFDWRTKNYAVHLWPKFHNVEHNATDIKTWNTTVGEVFRHIYYGNYKLIP